MIREARADELPQLVRNTLDAYGEFEEVMTTDAWAGLRSAVENALDSIPEEIQKIVAIRGSDLVGSVLLYPPASDAYHGRVASFDWPELRLLAVPSTERRSGIGKALVIECARRARIEGAHYLGLHTSKSMEAALRIYERLGFERFPEGDFQPEGGELVTAYRLDLERGEDRI